MTSLDKPVTRSVVLITDNRVRARDCDSYAVTLYPGGVIGFRPKRCRTEYQISLAAVCRMAVKQAAIEAEKAKKEKNHA